MPSTQACLKDLAQNRPGDYILLAEFCDVEEKTAQRWYEGLHSPHGQSLLKLRFFLMLAGYHDDELMNLSPVARDVGALIGYQILKPEEVQSLLDYRNITGVYATLLRG